MKKTIIIAEAGVNHNGNLKTAKKLIDVAAEAGADYVKFQTFKSEKLVKNDAPKATYQVKNTDGNQESQLKMLKKLELDEAVHKELMIYSESKKIKFLSTAFDLDSIDLLNNLGIEFFKIPSGEITNKPYLKKIARLTKPVVLSTGMSSLDEVKVALQVLMECGLSKDKIAVLHCNTEYPTPYEDVNLIAMKTMGEELGVRIGYSDHTLGIEVPIAAVALGASVIEKHFTLDKEMDGPDHKASLEPTELKQMIISIRNIEKALSGNGIKEPSLSESKNIQVVRKSLYYAKKLNKGHVLKEEDLLVLRPGNGISPMEMDTLIGRALSREVLEYEAIDLTDFE